MKRPTVFLALVILLCLAVGHRGCAYADTPLMARLKESEGLRLSSYRDSRGVWTIGYGTNLQDLTISEDLARSWLIADMAIARYECHRAFRWFEGLDPVRQDTLVYLVYNMGLPNLMTFRKALDAYRRHDFDEAANELLDSLWAQQVGERSNRLAEVVRTGRWD